MSGEQKATSVGVFTLCLRSTLASLKSLLWFSCHQMAFRVMQQLQLSDIPDKNNNNNNNNQRNKVASQVIRRVAGRKESWTFGEGSPDASSEQFGILQHTEEAGTTSTRVWIQKIKVRVKNKHTPAFGEVMKIKAFKEIIHIRSNTNLQLCRTDDP